MRRCPLCNNERIRRSKRRGFVERVPLTLLFSKPFHCGDCKHRFVRWPTVGARFNAIRAKLFTAQNYYSHNALDLELSRLLAEGDRILSTPT
jgi:hypothetical protein